MDENHQDKTKSKLVATEDELSPPPLPTKNHRRADSPQNNRLGAIIKRLGFLGYDKETKEYAPNGQLAKITKEHQPDKTFWDWLQLLIIPVILAGATIGFGLWQYHLADLQHQQDQQHSQDQQQATILQTYTDNIQDLLLNHNLLKANPWDPFNPYYEIATLARARTLTALQGLDPVRKGLLVKFIYEARLINNSDSSATNSHDPIINPWGADLSHADLSHADLMGAYLSEVDLSSSNLSGVDLTGANLDGANLTGANLSNAVLKSMIGFCANSPQATCTSPTIFVEGADFRGANLTGANLSGASLQDTNLGGANLTGANLSGVDNLNQKQLDQVSTCEGAILPQGLICRPNQ